MPAHFQRKSASRRLSLADGWEAEDWSLLRPMLVDEGAGASRLRMNALWPGGSAMAAHLRVYPLSKAPRDAEEQEPTVRVSLGDLLPLVALAHRHNYLWLQDFLEDEVTITSDLYEVLRAFRCYRPSA
jgi:hypothetical protein